MLENNLADITVAYESGWNKFTEKFYAKTEWPEAELIAPLVNDGVYNQTTWISTPWTCFLDPIFLILYRELYYRHVYSRLQPNIDDRFHSYENSCELFNYLLSACFMRSISRYTFSSLHRFWWPRSTRTSWAVALGYYWRIHLPISSLLHLAVKGFLKNTGWADDACWWWSRESSHSRCFDSSSLYIGMEFIQCSERPILFDAKV